MQVNVLIQLLRKSFTWNFLLLMMFQLNVRSLICQRLPVYTRALPPGGIRKPPASTLW